MIVHVNGEPTDVAERATVGSVVDRLDVPRGRRGVAVAVDTEVVPRSAWDDHELQAGARIEVLAAIQGGAA
jgi:sulfur carrier protein